MRTNSDTVRTQCPKPVPQLIEHVRLGDYQMFIDGLEMQPSDVLRAHVFAAVAGAFGRHHNRLVACGFNQQLLTAATL